MRTNLDKIPVPLSGISSRSNGFGLPPSIDDDYGQKTYDLRSVLLGNPRGFEREIGESIQARCPELRIRGLAIPWQVFLRGGNQSFAQHDLTAGVGTGASLVQTFREPNIEDALWPYSAVDVPDALRVSRLLDLVERGGHHVTGRQLFVRHYEAHMVVNGVRWKFFSLAIEIKLSEY
jgi:hypothetical protein